MRRFTLALGMCLTARCLSAQRDTTQRDTTVHVAFAGFVDTYYAYDFGRPPSFDRSFASGALFTTQPARHNEFNVNLAYVEAVVTGPRLRGRLALQAGTSVQSNYAGEPNVGVVSGPSLARNIQEAVAGYALTDKLWVDAGIFFSNVGMESWVSRDNPTYTRSLAAEYSPYYSSGVKLTWAATPKLTARLDVVNGWQNISENNAGKAAGVRLDYALTPTTTLSYYDLFSEENGTRLRTFNGVGAKAMLASWTLLGEADFGTQQLGPGVNYVSEWINTVGIARYRVAPIVAVSARGEYTSDPGQVVIVGGPLFHAVGGSLGVDVQPQTRVLWRSEVRGWRNRYAVFPHGLSGVSKADGFVVTSLALTF